MLADAPAKSLILNVKQYNGYYGCPYCLNKGEFEIKINSHFHQLLLYNS